ncbi:dolichyl-P-Man:Man(5)GlcNAc(2)-PP-dolichol alpha-1,3-mannosyltransferase [Ceratocystis pirilliformis]|uniref:Dol-P-Man:Man(5)GlcNAc(2)-PP-Dol alpha-1,3-mannosyltransferase n=1 Tax=Ceratocystis pirilliformis TaxID=259994 RepID=A0ABR3Z9K6_9PEZI
MTAPRATSPLSFVTDVATGRHPLSRYIAPGLWLGDAVLCVLVIWKVAYTEIDWVAYMQQMQQVADGERIYTNIEGSTGPLVYPAAHVWIYMTLYRLTNKGTNIFLAQQLFAVLYMATLAIVFACYRKAKAPPYLFPLLVLSKRLHSIFMLRCFNDCFAVFFLWLAIFLWQNRLWSLGTLAYAFGLGVKMTLLTALPGVGVVLFLGCGLRRAFRLAVLIVQLHIAIAVPFLKADPPAYVSRAFELTRVFKYEWTVNMRFLPEEAFLSQSLAIFLAACYVLNMLSFINFRWMEPAKVPFYKLVLGILAFRLPFSQKEEQLISQRVNSQFIMAVILTATNAGMLFARSLHYQFYVYIAWSTPFLMWYAGLDPFGITVLWVAQEWAWNVFPSTEFSSMVVVTGLLIVDRLSFSRRVETPLIPEASVVAESGKKTN